MRDELSVVDGVIVKGEAILIPKCCEPKWNRDYIVHILDTTARFAKHDILAGNRERRKTTRWQLWNMSGIESAKLSRHAKATWYWCISQEQDCT
jgi:hypothetical protein